MHIAGRGISRGWSGGDPRRGRRALIVHTAGVAALAERALEGGGFAGRAGGQYRADATAWAALALAEHDGVQAVVSAARRRLAADQLADGRVPVLPGHPQVAWPTALAVLAWRGATPHRESVRRGVAFLCEEGGRHWAVAPNSPFGHDTSLRGWPWVADTHSWVEPTSLAITALVAAGHADHPRVQEAVAMLLDRQLPEAGWNYGNTTVFGRVLRPFPDSTGVALTALAGRVERQRVTRSLAWLATEVARLRAPLATGWGLLGLAAWQHLPRAALAWTDETLARQEQVGPFDTAHLALLLLARRAARTGSNPLLPGIGR